MGAKLGQTHLCLLVSAGGRPMASHAALGLASVVLIRYMVTEATKLWGGTEFSTQVTLKSLRRWSGGTKFDSNTCMNCWICPLSCWCLDSPPQKEKRGLTLQSDAILMKHRDQHFGHWYIDRWLWQWFFVELVQLRSRVVTVMDHVGLGDVAASNRDHYKEIFIPKHS